MPPHEWTTSSYCSNNSCISTRWQTSTYSGGNGCVETRIATRPPGVIQVRDSKDERPDAPILEFAPEPWTAFIHAITTGAITRKPVTT